MTTRTEWHLLSGEYPPKPGGVSDYTRQLARALASRGEVVHAWAPEAPGIPPEDHGVELHRVSDLGPRGLGQLRHALALMPRPRRWFVQYVPTGMGLRGMNVPLIRWLQALEDEVWVQFHEVALGWQLWRKPHHHLMHGVQLWMAAALAGRADRIFISIEGWRSRLGPDSARAVWLPVPSNIPVVVPSAAENAARQMLGPGPWLAHFGTYGPEITKSLIATLRQVSQRHPDARFLLLGRGGERVLHGIGPDRVQAMGALPGETVAAYLKASALALLPFPDGISTRRGSAMAALGLGVPVVTTVGHLTDQVWHDGAVAMARAGDSRQLASLCLDLLGDPERLRLTGERGAQLYTQRFSLERTLEALVGPPDARVIATP